MRFRPLAIMLLGLLTAQRAEAQFRPSNPAPGENFNVELGLFFWTPTPEILIQTGALAAAGVGEVDFVQEFSLADETFMEFRSVLKAGRKHKFRISYIPFKYDKETTLQRTITFGGITVPVAVPAEAHLQWNLWRFGYEYDFVAADRALVGFITELKRNQFTAELSSPGLGSESTDITAPILTLGGILRVYPHRAFSITAEYTGFKVFGFLRGVADAIAEDLEISMQDLDIYGTVNFGSHVGAQGGYRALSTNYDLDEDSGDLKMKGWYFGGVVRF